MTIFNKMYFKMIYKGAHLTRVFSVDLKLSLMNGPVL